MRSALFLGFACATALPLIGLAQGVPIIDGTRVSNLISRLAEQAQDALKQEEKLGQQTRLNQIEDEQLAAYERFLADTTGTTDLSGFEDGGADFPPADEVYPNEETSPESQRLFGEGETVEAMIIATAHRYESHPGVVKVKGFLEEAKPQTPKEAVDQNTYMIAERARLMALTLRLRAGAVKVEAAHGLSDAAQALQYSTFWEYSDGQ